MGRAWSVGRLRLSVLMWAVLWDQQQWQTLSKKHCASLNTPKSSPVYGEFHSLRSLSHHFLCDFFPKVRHQKKLFAGSQTLHVKLWYNSYSCCFIKSMQSDVVGYEPRHNTPEQHCAHLRYGYSSCLIRWARQTSTGNASEITRTATAARVLTSLYVLDSHNIVVVKNGKGYQTDITEVRLKVS